MGKLPGAPVATHVGCSIRQHSKPERARSDQEHGAALTPPVGDLVERDVKRLADLDGALAIYEQHIKPANRPYPPLNIFTDGASLLWRLSLAGHTGLEPHWRDVAAYGEKYFPQAGAHFADVHFALAAAMTGGDALDTRLAQLEARAADGKLAPGGCAIDLCRGIRAFAEGDNDGAVRLLEPAISELTRIGGSHAVPARSGASPGSSSGTPKSGVGVREERRSLRAFADTRGG
jgi:hypothetical protein